MLVNSLPDPGAEHELWQLGGDDGYSGFVSTQVHTGARSIWLRNDSGLELAGWAKSQLIIVDAPTVERLLSIWVRTDNTSTKVRLRCSHYPDGFDEPSFAFDIVQGSELTNGVWAKRTSPITPNSPLDRVLIEAYATDELVGTANWHIDDGFYPGGDVVMARGMYNGWTALSDGLKSISGAPGGYWNDFSAVVFETLIQPADNQEAPNVYLCIPFAADRERFDDQDHRGVRCTWRQTIWAFVRDTKDHPSSTGTIELVSKIRDDLVRYFLLNPTLGGVVQNVRLLEGFRIAGADARDGYGYLELDVEIEQIVDPNDLGPDA